MTLSFSVLSRLLPKVKVRKEKNLLSSSGAEEETEEVEEVQPDIIVPHWHPNLTVTLISDQPNIPYTKLPPVVAQCKLPFPFSFNRGDLTHLP